MLVFFCITSCCSNILQPILEGKHECLLRKNCVRARARWEPSRETFFFFFPASQFSMDSSLHRLSLHINVMRTKGLKQLVHEIAIYATFVLFFLCTTLFPRVWRCACSINVHRAALLDVQRSPNIYRVWNIHH